MGGGKWQLNIGALNSPAIAYEETLDSLAVLVDLCRSRWPSPSFFLRPNKLPRRGKRANGRQGELAPDELSVIQPRDWRDFARRRDLAVRLARRARFGPSEVAH